MANKFCRQLSNGFKINVQGDKLLWSPCCFYTKKSDMGNTEQFVKDREYASNATKWLPECESCRKMEESGVELLHPRLNANHMITEDSVDGDCVNLEISFDTKCNAACLSCGSYCSTTWAKFDKKHGLNQHISPKIVRLENVFQRRLAEVQYKVTLDAEDSDLSDILFKQLIKNVPLDKLQTIFIMGGEPFYTKSHVKMLKHLKEIHPNLRNVSIRYQSNSSIYPSDEVLKLWEDYKYIVYGASLDGIRERFNYLRWPLKWHRSEKVLTRLVNETNVKLHVNCTISPLNILYVDELENWLKDNISTDKFSSQKQIIRPNACLGDMDLRFTSEKLKEKVYTKYGVDHDISKLVSSMEIYNDPARMFRYVDQMDSLRRLDWRKTFPDVADCY